MGQYLSNPPQPQYRDREVYATRAQHAENRVRILEERYGPLFYHHYDDPDNFYDLFIRNADKEWSWDMLLDNPNIKPYDINRAVSIFNKDEYFREAMRNIGRNPNISWENIKGILEEYPNILVNGYVLQGNKNITTDDLEEALIYWPQVDWRIRRDSPKLEGIRTLDNFRLILKYLPELRYFITLDFYRNTWDDIKEFFDEYYPQGYNDNVMFSYRFSKNPNITWKNVKEGLRRYPTVLWHARGLAENPNITWDDIKEAIRDYPELEWNEDIVENPNITWDNIKEAIRDYPEIGWRSFSIPHLDGINLDRLKWIYEIRPNIFDDMIKYYGRITVEKLKNLTSDDVIYLVDEEPIDSPFHLPKDLEFKIHENTTISLEEASYLKSNGYITFPDYLKFLFVSPNVSWDFLKEFLITYPDPELIEIIPESFWSDLSKNPKINLGIIVENPSYPWNYSRFLSVQSPQSPIAKSAGKR